VDQFEARLPQRWRALLVVCSLAAMSPVFLLVPERLSAPAGRAVAAVLVVAQAGALWWTRIRPGLVTAVALGVGSGIQLLYPSVGPGVALIVLCTFAWLRPARVSVWALAAAMVLTTAVSLSSGRRGAAVVWLIATLLAWSWGALGRARSAWRQAEVGRAMLEERARIARELHDVLAHTVSVMVVQAAAADDVFESNPASARVALRNLESTGRQALTELRHFLWTVRSVEDEPASDPQPRLSDLDRLAQSLATTGLDVQVRRDGLDRAALASAVELSAYRIVQEALTNTLRHAAARKAEVALRVDDDQLLVEVRDDGTAGGDRVVAHGGGHGIAGMRERAALVGGSLDAGPDPAGGFRVCARLPLAGPS
jgi:signal transduction histidine kinase